MRFIARIDNRTPNSEATTERAMRDAGYRWNKKKEYWVKGASE